MVLPERTIWRGGGGGSAAGERVSVFCQLSGGQNFRSPSKTQTKYTARSFIRLSVSCQYCCSIACEPLKAFWARACYLNTIAIDNRQSNSIRLRKSLPLACLSVCLSVCGYVYKLHPSKDNQRQIDPLPSQRRQIVTCHFCLEVTFGATGAVRGRSEAATKDQALVFGSLEIFKLKAVGETEDLSGDATLSVWPNGWGERVH